MRARACRAILFAGALIACIEGCGAGSYVWVDAFPAKGGEVEGAYTVASGDLLNIRVYNQDTISTRGRVGTDGKIAIPLVGEIDAKGLSPATLSRQIEERLRPFIVSPSVSILVEEAQPVKISVLGEIGHAGVISVPPGTRLLQVLALAGGITEYATRDRIFVLRDVKAGEPLRIRFTYQDLIRGVGRAGSFRVESGDAVVVE